MWGLPSEKNLLFQPLVLKIVLNIEVEFSSLIIPLMHLHIVLQIINYLTEVWEG